MSVAQRKARARRNNETNRRDELLRVSAKLFREKGFDGTSIRDISGAAGMHSGSPFYHFKTKQDILLAVMEQGLAEGLHLDPIASVGVEDDFHAAVHRLARRHRVLDGHVHVRERLVAGGVRRRPQLGGSRRIRRRPPRPGSE